MTKDKKTFSHAKYVCVLFVIIVFSLIIRLIRIRLVPSGISTDVLLYFINARSIAETGKDIYGRFFPLFSSHKGFLLSPVVMYVMALFYKLFGFSFTVGYLPNILIATASIFIAGLFATYLTGKRRIGIITALLLSVSPWHYHLSRTGFEGVFGYSLVLIGIYCSLLALKKPKYFIFSFILFAIAMFAYKAINIFLIVYPFIFAFTVGWKKSKLSHVILFIIAIWTVVILQWFFLFIYYHDTYSTGFINNNIQNAALNVESDRVMSDAPHVVRLLLSNVPLSLTHIYLANYLQFFSPQYLLINGDNDLRYSTGRGGQIYLLDVFFIVTGIVWLAKTRKKVSLFLLLSIIVVAPLAALISDQEYAVRTFISVFALAILGACGVEQFIGWGKTTKLRKVIIVIIGGLYVFSVIQYLYRYQFLYVHYAREAWDGVNEQVFTEANHLRGSYRRIAFGRSTEFYYLEFMYWNILPIHDMQKALKTYDGKTLTYDNILFVSTCSFQSDDILKNSIKNDELLYTPEPCIKDIPPLQRYYLPKTLTWLWKTYDAQTVNLYFANMQNTGAQNAK